MRPSRSHCSHDGWAAMYHGESFADLAKFYQALDDYIYWYNHDRIQQRLKGLAPMQYRNQTLEPSPA